ncbi:MAG: hypothetical protein DMG31_12695 [Acidobacteria bacterium]|nr:MAG: hypothetical protein DMG31_12695 [Acidobacteriota bacterium]
MNWIKIVIFTALAVVVFIPVQSLSAQSSSGTVAVITKLENDGIKADLAADSSWAEKVLADDWMGCDSDGKWYTKADILKMIADTKNNKFNTEKLTDLKVRVYGNTAVATYKDTYDALVEGQHCVRSVLGTDVWVKIGSDWKQVSSQGTTTK